MGLEIERKFLVDSDRWNAVEKGNGRFYKQGYLATNPLCVVRVRLSETDAFLTVKGAGNGLSRPEYEYAVPLAEAKEMLEGLCTGVVTKQRYRIMVEGKLWEVDEFSGENAGLVLAEIELTHEAESFARPPWLGLEVTSDPRYYNASLAQHPYRLWQQS